MIKVTHSIGHMTQKSTIIISLLVYWFIFTLLFIGCTDDVKKKNIVQVDKINERACYNVAFLIMDGVYNTEFTAPFDIFQHTIFREGIKPMCVFSVAETSDAVTSFEGIRILPDFNYLKDELPQIDILVVPSAEHHLDSDLDNVQMIGWIRNIARTADFITSHCDGAFVLAKAGLLENKVSTSFPSDIDAMRVMFPELDIRKDVLFVHDDNIITSAGGAKSFEAALYLCEYLYGKEIAESLAGGLVIDWDLESVPHLVVER